VSFLTTLDMRSWGLGVEVFVAGKLDLSIQAGPFWISAGISR
jgi:hypothetical protein